MSGHTQLVYGDGWEDLKDCCGGGLFSGRGRSSSYSGGGGYRDKGCTKTHLAIGLAFLWLFILTIVAIVLGSKISATTNSHLSTRLESLRDDHDSKHSSHARILDDLTSSHRNLRGRVEGVAGDLGRLNSDVDRLEGNLRSDVKNKLELVRTTLMEALDRVGNSIKQIRADVEKGMVKKKRKK